MNRRTPKMLHAGDTTSGVPRSARRGRLPRLCSGVNSQPAAPALSRICSGRFAPHRAAVMPGWWIVHVITSCATVWPGRVGHRAELVDQVVVLLPLVAVEHGILSPVVVLGQDVVAAQAGRPEDPSAAASRPAPRRRARGTRAACRPRSGAGACCTAAETRPADTRPRTLRAGRASRSTRRRPGSCPRPSAASTRRPIRRPARSGRGRAGNTVPRDRCRAAAGSLRTGGGAWPGRASRTCLPAASQCSPPLVAITISSRRPAQRPGDQPLALAVAAVACRPCRDG